MAKKVVVTDKVKIRGIRRRWLINSVGVVLLVLAMALGTFAAAMWSYYYTTTINDLQRQAEAMTGVPKPLECTDKVTCVVEYRDGTVIDVIREVKK